MAGQIKRHVLSEWYCVKVNKQVQHLNNRVISLALLWYVYGECEWVLTKLITLMIKVDW